MKTGFACAARAGAAAHSERAGVQRATLCARSAMLCVVGRRQPAVVMYALQQSPVSGQGAGMLGDAHERAPFHVFVRELACDACCADPAKKSLEKRAGPCVQM